MAKDKIHKVSKVEINQSLPETITSEELDILASVVLSDENAVMTIHSDIDGLEAELFDLKHFIKRAYTDMYGIPNSLDTANVSESSLSGILNVTNGKKEVANALHRQFPNLTVNVSNDGDILWFRDGYLYEYFKFFFDKEVFHVSDFNVEKAFSLSNLPVEYFNEYKMFKTSNCNGFTRCGNLKEVTLPSRITTIGASMFLQNYELVKINLDNILSFGTQSFENCEKLKDITLSENCTEIGNRAFYNCYELNLDHLPSKLKTIGPDSLRETKVSISEIPSSVTSAGNNAFYNCKNIKRMVYNSNANIPTSFFENTSNLTEVIINGNVKSIGASAFQNSGIKKLKLNNGIEVISGSAFSACPIEELDIDIHSLTTVGSSAFSGCVELFTQKMIQIDKNGEKFVDVSKWGTCNPGNFYTGTVVDYRCNYLIFGSNSVMSQAMTTAASNGFVFEKLYFNGTFEEYCEYFGSSTGTSSPMYHINTSTYNTTGGLFVKDGDEFKRVSGRVVIPKNVKIIGQYMFFRTYFITSIVAPQLETISYYSVYPYYQLFSFNSNIERCTYLPNVITISSMYLLGTYYLYLPSIQSLTNILLNNTLKVADLGDKITSIAQPFHHDCNTLSIVIRAKTPPSYTASAFYNFKRLYVPSSSLEAYKVANNWWRFASKTFAIGGAEWVAEFGSANEWADYPDGIEPFSNPNLINSLDDID